MNFDNYIAVLRQIEADHSKWDQGRWCGTPCCFAGHAQVLAGKHYEDEATTIINARDDAMEFLGSQRHGVLALTCTWLFSAKRTLDDFRRVAIALANGRAQAIAAGYGRRP